MPIPRRNRWLRDLACGLSVLAACACGGPASPNVPHAEPGPRLVGRFDRDGRFQWSGSRIEALVRGGHVTGRIGAEPGAKEAVPYSAWVDGTLLYRFDVAPGPPHTFTIGPLRDGETSSIAIVREGEAHGGVHRFLGLGVEGGELLPPPPPRRRMEVIGDSISCGYGVLGENEQCHFSFATESFSDTYEASAARSLGMDLVTQCWSGRGVIRNYDGTTSGTMPELYQPAAAPADVVVVALGTNDFLGGKGAPLDTAAFEARYIAFLAQLREQNPQARIVVTSSPMLGEDVREAARRSFDRIVAARHDVLFLDMEYQATRRGCDYHPNAEMHRILAKQLVGLLAPHG
jgi:lysophospholipase L1-like esterase